MTDKDILTIRASPTGWQLDAFESGQNQFKAITIIMESDDEEPTPPRRAQVINPYGLRIRAGPDINQTILGMLPNNLIVDVLDVREDQYATCWVRHAKGWSALKYQGTPHMRWIDDEA